MAKKKKLKLDPELICPGDEHGINKGNIHIGNPKCNYCPARRKRREWSKKVELITEMSYSGPSWKKLDRGVRIPAGASRNLRGIVVKNPGKNAIHLDRIRFGEE